ncbi:hypothetical protein [Aeromonas veronii]|uniref:hypothetical protein n=1 Tax=Aeromonas veronii TaxID=654 RepID=UPI001F36C96F|nr:hypothetical protein [Aeromonas veronii]
MTLFSGNPPALRWPPAFARQFIVKVAGLALLALTGLGTVFYYTYLTIQHDMDLITARQKNVFEVFYQRAKILKVENITSYLAQHHLLDQPPPRIALAATISTGMTSKANTALPIFRCNTRQPISSTPSAMPSLIRR